MEPTKKPRGRKKKPDSSKKKAHPVYATDQEWEQIVKGAELAGEEVSPYIIKKALS